MMNLFHHVLRQANYFFTQCTLTPQKHEVNVCLTSFFSQPTSLIFVPTGGYNAPTFFVQGKTSGKILGVLKAASWWREFFYRRIHSRPYKNHYYLLPEERFLREYNILKVLCKAGLTPRPFFREKNFWGQEFLPGESLQLQLLEGKKADSLDTFKKGLQAIRKIHQLNYYHGDASAKNLLAYQGTVKFIDFEYKFKEGYFSRSQLEAHDYATLIATTYSLLQQDDTDYLDAALHYLSLHVSSEIIRQIPHYRQLEKRLPTNSLLKFHHPNSYLQSAEYCLIPS